jgi:hypothetical protein
MGPFFGFVKGLPFCTRNISPRDTKKGVHSKDWWSDPSVLAVYTKRGKLNDFGGEDMVVHSCEYWSAWACTPVFLGPQYLQVFKSCSLQIIWSAQSFTQKIFGVFPWMPRRIPHKSGLTVHNPVIEDSKK